MLLRGVAGTKLLTRLVVLEYTLGRPDGDAYRRLLYIPEPAKTGRLPLRPPVTEET